MKILIQNDESIFRSLTHMQHIAVNALNKKKPELTQYLDEEDFNKLIKIEPEIENGRELWRIKIEVHNGETKLIGRDLEIRL